MEVTECTFEDNTANAAGAIGNVGELTLTESMLNKNTAGYGGSIVNVGNLVVKDSILTNNKVTEAQGGAIASQYGGTMKITESTLEKNKATSGGAIYSINSDVRLKDCSFIDNTSEDKGAAVCHETYASSDYDESSKSFLSCSNCDFDNNHSKMGGSVWTNDYVSFEKCRFRRNFSQDEGNVIYFDGMAEIKMNITDSFIENTNAVNSDIYLKNPSFITIKNTNINNNSDNYVIRNENATLKISNTTFENNKTAVYNNHSVWIDEDGLEKYIESTGNAVVKNYMKASSSSNGFADLDALIKSSSDKIILESDIVMNECERFRYMDGIELNRDLTIDGQNHSIDAKKLSRIFKITCANVTLKNIQFKNGCYHKSKFHEDKEGGGAIYVLDNASVTIENCTFTENDSNNSAGCINNRGVMVIHNSIFKNNYAQRICGSIFNDNQLNLYDCSFEDNFAPSDKNSIEKYIETWGNIVNEGNISIKSCKFKNTNYFNLESVKIRTSNIMNYLLYPGLISFGIMIFGCIISTVINLIFPQSVIGEYLTKFTAADLVFLLVVMLISIILTLVQTSIKKYMNRNGFENYITE
ncbi:MAG: hypothetical protein BZ137_00740 [Methanosphaera sp. rholeuAM130]|nr:MAG: hypothetical protein BZ137_00740 [Methanosphaera sp. rholeuAM130]